MRLRYKGGSGMIGERLLELRKDAGMTQDALSARLAKGVSRYKESHARRWWMSNHLKIDENA